MNVDVLSHAPALLTLEKQFWTIAMMTSADVEEEDREERGIQRLEHKRQNHPELKIMIDYLKTRATFFFKKNCKIYLLQVLQDLT